MTSVSVGHCIQLTRWDVSNISLKFYLIVDQVKVLSIRADWSLSVPEHQTDRHKCDWSRQVSTHALSQELLHQGLRGQVDIFTLEILLNIMITRFYRQVRSASRWWGGYPAATGCHTERGSSEQGLKSFWREWLVEKRSLTYKTSEIKTLTLWSVT